MIDELVGNYHKRQAKIEEIKARHEEELKPLLAKQEIVKAELMRLMDEMGVENVRTVHGTPYFSHPETYKVTDAETFMQWVTDHDAWGVLPKTLARKTEVREVLERTGEATPAGVEVSTVRILTIGKPK